ncbi:glucosaminidase domain-containing protein, partial [Listeria monocytogenes]|uniref:glucosaminidase domain-containing protein n=1 Tax=Listeria monocytogenes TaxID=1639 RepID=UPI002948C02A
MKKIAPQYGFVLRFPDGKTAETGVGYEFFILFPLLNHKGKVDANSRQSVTYTKEEFIQKIVPDAQDLGKSYGIRPSFIIAQAALDSDFGEKILANKYHNLFGLLAEPGMPSITL